jgi:hypothetical protein
MSSDEIKLWCWIQGDKRYQIFDVKVELSDDVTDLKKSIQAWKPSFKDITVDSLKLYKVNDILTHR